MDLTIKTKKISNISIYETEKFISILKSFKEQFTIYITTFTCKIECVYGTFRFSANGVIKKSELYFITKVKRHVIKLPTYPHIDQSKIEHQRSFMRNNRRYTKDLYELDLSAAYWSITYKDGYIDKELYEKGLTLSKKVRLVALGALAKKLIIEDFDGEKYVNRRQEPLHESAHVFFNAQYKTSLLMKEARAIAGKDTMFIWSDAIFFRGLDNLKKLVDFFEKKEIKFKYFKIDSINYRDYVATVTSTEYGEANKGKKEVRPFNFSKMGLDDIEFLKQLEN